MRPTKRARGPPRPLQSSRRSGAAAAAAAASESAEKATAATESAARATAAAEAAAQAAAALVEEIRASRVSEARLLPILTPPTVQAPGPGIQAVAAPLEDQNT